MTRVILQWKNEVKETKIALRNTCIEALLVKSPAAHFIKMSKILIQILETQISKVENAY